MPGDASWRSRSASRARRCGSTALIALAVGALPVLGACGTDDGRTLRAPAPDQTTTTSVATTQPPTSDGAVPTSASEPLRLSSPVITEGGEIPAAYTCRGADVSPPLLWTGVPPGTVELAVVVRDVDADGFVHWVVAGLPPATGGLAEDSPPAESVEATNDFGRAGWSGPCPPAGTHNYEFRVYALPQPSGVTDGQAGTEAAAQIEAAPALASAILSASASSG